MDDTTRAQSEVIGFTLLFSLILITSGIVFIQGTNGINQAREVEQTQNAVRAFDILSNNINDVTRDAAPQRETEIQLGGATLSISEPLYYNVSITDSSGTTRTYASSMYTLRYESDKAGTVVYQNGAIFTEYGTGDDTESVLVSEPPFKIDGNNILLSQYRIQPNTDETTRVSGEGTALIVTQGTNNDVVVASDADRVTVEFGPTNQRDAWVRYFEENGFSCSPLTSEKAECEKTGINRVHVQTWYLLSELR